MDTARLPAHDRAPMSVKRFQPQTDASGLVEHPHRCTLRGEPESLAFPPLCASCGGTAATRIGYSKVFTRSHSDSPTEHVVTSVEVPFCADCAARHRAEVQVPTRLSQVLSSFATGDMLGALFPALGAAFFGYVGIGDLLRGSSWMRAAGPLGFAAFLALIAWYQRRHVWRDTLHLRVVPQTDVTRAFDFSDNVAPAFEPPRFACTMRNAGFAAAFATLNADRAWVAHSPQAKADRRRAKRSFWLIGAVVLALALFGWWFGD
jgi:hypothetical protein